MAMTTIQLDHVGQTTVLPQDNYILSLLSILRDQDTDNCLFATTVDKLARSIVSVALNHVPCNEYVVKTATGGSYNGRRPSVPVCGVSILRAGASLEQALRDCFIGTLHFGHVLIQRDEITSLPTYLYSKLPTALSQSTVFLLEPMLATGGSACKAIEVLIEKGAREEGIVFVNVIASRHGLEVLRSRFPKLNFVTAAVDEELTASNFIYPGLGDFGDRYYGNLG